jgi:hypothetical protein
VLPYESSPEEISSRVETHSETGHADRRVVDRHQAMLRTRDHQLRHQRNMARLYDQVARDLEEEYLLNR